MMYKDWLTKMENNSCSKPSLL